MLKASTMTAAAAAALAISTFAAPANAQSGVAALEGRSCGETFAMINQSSHTYQDDHIDVTEAIAFDMPDGLFQELDTDNNMMVTRDEFEQCQTMATEYKTWTVVIVDGRVVPAVAGNQYATCDYQFSLMNHNPAEDEHISVTEAGNMSTETFNRIDKDGNMMLTRDEFRNCGYTNM